MTKLANFFNNPLVAIEIRLRMRTKKTLFGIIFYLIAMTVITLGIVAVIIYSNGYIDPNNSKVIFIAISMIQYALICIIVPALTSGTISGEREKQTLNILLTTRLSATKLILGKWFSSLSYMMLLIVATIPVFGVVFLYGGIAPEQLLSMLGVYLSTMLAIGSLGVLYSTIFKRTIVAIILTYITIVAYTALTYIIPALIAAFSMQNSTPGAQPSVIVEWLFSVNPYSVVVGMLAGPNLVGISNRLPLDPYWIFMIFFALVTIIFLVLAIRFIQPVRGKLKFKK